MSRLGKSTWVHSRSSAEDQPLQWRELRPRNRSRDDNLHQPTQPAGARVILSFSYLHLAVSTATVQLRAVTRPRS